VPIYVAATREAALADAREGIIRFSTYRADLIRGPMNYERALHEKCIVGTPDMVIARLRELADENRARRRLRRGQPRQPARPRAGAELVAALPTGGHAVLQITGSLWLSLRHCIYDKDRFLP
jgi:alkanesulfonate monooxygenase SsuD/methylene tetrahydromethanopterin reductase-like flavin-dependent oxidoreductase (luciferase family)